MFDILLQVDSVSAAAKSTGQVESVWSLLGKGGPLMIPLGILFALAVLFMFGIYFSSGNEKYYWTVFGAELLFFMLLNAFSFLLIKNPGRYLKRIILFYIIKQEKFLLNFICLILYLNNYEN